MHAQMWDERLGRAALPGALDELRPARSPSSGELRPRLAERIGRELPPTSASERGTHSDELAGALGGDDRGAALGAGGRRGDRPSRLGGARRGRGPGDPCHLGRRPRRRPRRPVEDDRVHVEFTPTFLGCPALEVMRAQMAERIRELGGSRTSRSCSTTRGRPTGSRRRAARSCAQAGFAPPTPREVSAPTLVQLQSDGFRCPYCGSSDTRAREHLRPDSRAARCATARLQAALRAVQTTI